MVKQTALKFCCFSKISNKNLKCKTINIFMVTMASGGWRLDLHTKLPNSLFHSVYIFQSLTPVLTQHVISRVSQTHHLHTFQRHLHLRILDEYLHTL